MSAQSNVTRDTIPSPARSASESGTLSDTISEAFEPIRARSRDAYGRAKDRVVEKEQAFEHYVSDHPVKSVLVAAGIGAAVGLLAGIFASRR